MKKIPALLLLLLAFACTNKSNPENSGSSTPGSTSTSFDVKIRPSSKVELAPGESTKLTYEITGNVTNPTVTASAPSQVQVVVTPASDKLSGTLDITLASSVSASSYQFTLNVAADGATVTKTIDVAVDERVTPQPTPGGLTPRRPIRTIKMVETGDEAYIWFEYDSQNRVTKASIWVDYDKEIKEYTFSYPTSSTVVATYVPNGSTFTFFISEARLMSFTEPGNAKMTFNYDASGKLSSFDQGSKTNCTWSGDDLTAFSNSSGLNQTMSYSSKADNNGISFLLAYSAGDLDEMDLYFLLPVIAPLAGINSAHLPKSQTLNYSGTSSTVSYDYDIDSQGSIKTILTDDGIILNIWYTDEAESADEKPAGMVPPPPAEPIERRPVRTIKLLDEKEDRFAWFEYNSQNKVTKATLWDGGTSIDYNYTYPTQNSVVVSCPANNMSVTLFMSEGWLTSITPSSGDKITFVYDSKGHLYSFDERTCTWTGDDLTSIDEEKSSISLSYGTNQDKNGASFMIALTEGDIEDMYLFPVLSTMPGLNSAHLPVRKTFGSSYGGGFSINFVYTFDNQGCIKTITSDGSQGFKIWYNDEPESSEEKPDVDPVVPPVSDAITVSGEQFFAASPSETQLYRITGAIDSIKDDDYGDFYLKTADGYYLYIYGANSTPGGYGAANDHTFAARKLRRGDEVTMVGYRGVYNDQVEMLFGYVEDSYRLQASDFAGTYFVFCDMYEYEEQFVFWSGTQVIPDGEFLLFQGMSYYSYSDSSNNWLDNSATALGYYDDDSGTVTLLGGWYNSNYNWYYTSGGPDSQRYISLFYPVLANNSEKKYSFLDNVSVGPYSGTGAIVLQPSCELRGSDYFGFERKGTPEESQYIFLDYEYDVEQRKTTGSPLYRSSIHQFWFMYRTSTSYSSSKNFGPRNFTSASTPVAEQVKVRKRR